MDGLDLDFIAPSAGVAQAAWPIPLDAAGPMIAWAIAALILIAGMDLVLPAKNARR